MCERLQICRAEFTNALKTVLKENISKNPATLNANRDRITEAFNNLIIEIRKLYPTVNENDKLILDSLFRKSKDRISRAYSILNCNYCIPEDFYSLICPTLRSEIQTTETSPLESQYTEPKPSTSKLLFIDPTLLSSQSFNTTTNSQSNPTVDQQNFDIFNNSTDSNVDMAELSAIEFLKLCSSTINKNFDGNPLSLQSFLDSISLLTVLAVNDISKNILLRFVLSKLEGKARECVTQQDTLDNVISQLKSKIKCENSKVIEGRMQALRADRVKLQDFSKQADELADSFRRALIMEGIPSHKAQDMAIEKTVEMCRASARSDLTKAVISSTSFTDPKEVVAKFLVEINSEYKEKQVLAFRSQRNKNYHNKNSRSFSNNYSNSRSNNLNSRQQNYNNRSNNYSQNTSFNSQNRQNSNRNFQNRSNYNPRNYNNQQNYSNQNRRQNVRYMENSDAPQWHQNQQQRLGEDQNSQFSNQQ